MTKTWNYARNRLCRAGRRGHAQPDNAAWAWHVGVRPRRMIRSMHDHVIPKSSERGPGDSYGSYGVAEGCVRRNDLPLARESRRCGRRRRLLSGERILRGAPRSARALWKAPLCPCAAGRCEGDWEAAPSFVRRRWTIPPSPATESRSGLSRSQEVTRTDLVEAATIRDAIFRSAKAPPRTPLGMSARNWCYFTVPPRPGGGVEGGGGHALQYERRPGLADTRQPM
jgi:hypothetical protein